MTHPEQRPFVVGDRVKAFGLNGVVGRIIEKDNFPVEVDFEDGERRWFLPDGRWYTCHKTPSLKHRRFKPKAKLREFWLEFQTSNDCFNALHRSEPNRSALPFSTFYRVREVRKGRK